MKAVFTIVIIVFCIVANTQTTLADSVYSKKPMKVGIIGVAKWGKINDNPITGIMREQSNAIFRMANIYAIHSYARYPRLVKQLERGSIDCAILTKPAKTQEKHLMISHLYDVEIIALGRKGSAINTYQDFHNKKQIKTVGFPNGGKYLFPELYLDLKVKKQIIPSQQQGPLMLAKGRIDSFVGMKYSLLYGIHRDKLLNKTNYPGYRVQQLEVWLQCSKKSKLAAKNIERLKLAVQRVESMRAFSTIIDKWMSFLFINQEI